MKGVNGKGTLTGKFEPVTDGKLHTVYVVTYPDGEGTYSLVAIENIIFLNK